MPARPTWIRTKQLLIGVGIGLCVLATPIAASAKGTAPPPPQHSASTSNAAGILKGGHPGGTPDSCGYDPSGTPLFSENDIVEGAQVYGSGSSAQVAIFGADEKGILFPVTGNDVLGRPENPSLFLTDITSSPGSTSGDWQKGGAANSMPDAMYGYTTGTIGVTATLKSAIPAPFGSFPFSFAGGKLNAVGVWNASTLNLTAGHTYRVQMMVHDGDQNKTGGDVGEACVNLSIPGNPGGPECTPNKTVSPSGSVPIGTVLTYTVTMMNSGKAAGDCALTDVLSASTATTVDVTALPAPPAGTTMSIINGACTPAQCSELPLTINWSVPGLAAGDSKSFTMKVTVTGAGSTNSTISSASLNGTVTNTATSTSHCTANCIIIVHNPVMFALTKSVTPAGNLAAPFPQSLRYSVTLTNTSANDATTGVLVDDVLSGTAAFTVDDTSFKGPSDMGPVTKVATGHYRWTIPAHDLTAGAAAPVSFSVSITNAGNNDGSTLASCIDAVGSGSLCLDNVATALAMRVHVQNQSPPGQVQAITTTPSTGTVDPRGATAAGFLFLGGLGMILLGMLLKAPIPASRRSRV